MTPDAETILWSRLIAAENALTATANALTALKTAHDSHDKRIAELESARVVQIKLNAKFEEATKVKPEKKPWWPF